MAKQGPGSYGGGNSSIPDTATSSTRRGFLAVTGALATAGCSGLSGSSTTTPTETDEPVFTDRGRAEIKQGRHLAFEFRTDTTGQIRVSYDVGVITDGEIGIALLTESEYEDYENGGPVSYVPQLSEFPTTGTRRDRTVDSGSYALVFDNTTRFTEPTGEQTVEFTITIRPE